MIDVTKVVRSGAAIGSLGVAFATGAAVGVVNRDRQAGANVAATLGGSLALALAGIDLEVTGQSNAWAARPAIFVFNHQSQLDVPIVAAVLRQDFTGVAKKSLKVNPVFGPIGRLGGVAFIDRSDPSEARAALQPVIDNLRSGISIAVAPEGTRSLELGPFKKGPFHMAIQGEVPMVPIVIRNAGQIMAPHSYLVNPGTVEVAVLAPVDTSEWTPQTVTEHRDEVWAMFRDTLDNWPG